ncbi:MAG: phosphopantothenoylcysteine decarboxylase [Phycisphaerales bacterium]|nr:phosphopantothenoylcysteine decarboxylase [Phycisphaerales bacterium]
MRILITAGPTREYFDSVRYISNGSSGKLGYAIASAGERRGHEVVLISGPVALAPPVANTIQVESADEMLAAANAAFTNCAAAIMTAAVADYRPAVRETLKSEKPKGVHQITLEPTPDICATLGAGKGDRVVVGFALQDADGERRAESKLDRKHCDAIVLNSPETIGSDRARLRVLVADAGWREPFDATKREAAERIIDLVEELVARRRSTP